MSISSEISRIQSAKSALAISIAAKGVTVPAATTLDGYAALVDSIQTGGGGDDTFEKLIKRTINSVTIPSGVTEIPNYMFDGCTQLTSVTFNGSETAINDYAFRNTGLTSVSLPNTLTSIGVGALYNTDLTSITIPDQVDKLNNYTFQNCSSLISVVIGNGVTSIGVNCFYQDSALTTVDIGSGVTSISNNAFMTCKNLGTLICRATTPPTVTATVFGTAASNYCGRNNYSAGTNKLYVPKGCSSAYNTSYWASVLLDSNKCGFTIAELDADGNIPT